MSEKESDDHDFQPPRKWRSRFKAIILEKEMAILSKGFTPGNTQRNTGWAMRFFQEWKAERSKGDAEKCPKDFLNNPDIQNLNYWLSQIVAEIRKQDGQPYPPRTIHQILAGLQRYMLEKQPNAPKFLDRTQTAFRELHGTCDSVSIRKASG